MRLPLTPGVYIMKDKKGKIIYIGKAKALKNRVSQYFGSQERHAVKVRRMVEHVADFVAFIRPMYIKMRMVRIVNIHILRSPIICMAFRERENKEISVLT